MGVFPLPDVPQEGWGPGAPMGLGFGSKRVYGSLTLLHGACDLLADAGTKVFAVERGTIIRRYATPYPFAEYKNSAKVDKNGKVIVPACHSWTYALDVQHDNFIVRYCEIGGTVPNGVTAGADVEEGQVIGYVGVQCGGTMLHFEMFQHANRLDQLTLDTNPKYLYVKQGDYYRREDLLDPTFYLYEWAGLCGSQGCTDPTELSRF